MKASEIKNSVFAFVATILLFLIGVLVGIGAVSLGIWITAKTYN